MLSEEQTKEIKKQLIAQINSTFPEDRKNSAIEEIETMNNAEFEEFLKQNKLIKENDEQCIFCAISEKKVDSYIIGENSSAVAVLEINPVSHGHAIIIPKEHSNSDLTDDIIALSNQVSKKIKEKLKPKEMDLSESEMFGHKILNIIPVYTNENSHSKRKRASKEELEKIKEELEKKDEHKTEDTHKEKVHEPHGEKKSEEKSEKPEEEINEHNTWLPRRIP